MTVDTSEKILARPGGFAAGYAAHPSGIDEMIEPDGSLRAHWRMFVSLLDDLGPDELPRRLEQARRLIRENGITHNVYGDPNGLERPWNLDMIPLLLPAQEWRAVSDALVQRATLLDKLLADIYGPGRLVAEGILPPELVYSNHGFLRACHGISLPRGQWLHLYAADLVRMGDGDFRVLSDRTQAPSGAGYSLENRIVLSGVLPSVFRQCNVHRLAPFFIALRQTMSSLAPANREMPRVVVLTPGPYNETYFEHAYLARYLGYTLVQGNDLTVRDGRVFLKTLSGLQRIDVILRRVDDDFCDPLELYSHSFLGIPGLVEAVREGNVAVANALGTGVLQAPAFLSFLPEVCRRLLGEDLKIPSVQTWWCGDPQSLRYVNENLRRLVIKPAFPSIGSHPEFGDEMSAGQLDQLAARISAHPVDYVAQEHVISRSAPVLLDNRVQARRFVVRAYLAAADGSYTVMPGGLTRVTESQDSLVVSLQKGGGSKDTWILADGPVSGQTLLSTATQVIELSRGGGDLPSRVADDMFWLGRYVQRAEGDARIARCLFGRLSDNGRPDNLATARILMDALLGPNRFRLEEGGMSALVAEVFGEDGAGSMRSAIEHVQGLVRSLRDRVSGDAWRVLQGIETDLSEFDANKSEDHVPAAVQLLNRLAIRFLAFSGVIAESMTRGQAWRFLDLGTRLERALVMARLIRATLVDVRPDESAILDALLEMSDSSLTYRRRYLTQLDVAAVVDLLVADETNPRAVAYQVAAIEQHLLSLPREVTHPQGNPHIQRVLQLRTQLKLADLRRACDPGKSATRDGLRELMTETIDGLAEVTELVSQIYFSHAAIPAGWPARRGACQVKYTVTHTTEYFYGEPVPLCHNVVHLKPRDTARQTVLSHLTTVTPNPVTRSERLDFFGNLVSWFGIQEPHSSLRIMARSLVDVRGVEPPTELWCPAWDDVTRMLKDRRVPGALDAMQFRFDSPFIQSSPELADYARPSFSPGRPLLECLIELTNRIHKEFKFDVGVTTIGTPVLEVLRHRHGVCQDFAHLQIGCLRALGLAVRYVSGYLVTKPPPGRPRLVGCDVSHAWVSAFIPDFGWIDFDPTNGMIPSTGHITLGWARDYGDISPVRGVVVGGRRHSLRVSVDVEPMTPEEKRQPAGTA